MVSVMKADEVWGVRAVRSATEDGGGSMGLPFVRRLGLDQSVTFTKVEAGLVELEWFAAEHLEKPGRDCSGRGSGCHRRLLAGPCFLDYA